MQEEQRTPPGVRRPRVLTHGPRLRSESALNREEVL